MLSNLSKVYHIKMLSSLLIMRICMRKQQQIHLALYLNYKIIFCYHSDCGRILKVLKAGDFFGEIGLLSLSAGQNRYSLLYVVIVTSSICLSPAQNNDEVKNVFCLKVFETLKQ